MLFRWAYIRLFSVVLNDFQRPPRPPEEQCMPRENNLTVIVGCVHSWDIVQKHICLGPHGLVLTYHGHETWEMFGCHSGSTFCLEGSVSMCLCGASESSKGLQGQQHCRKAAPHTKMKTQRNTCDVGLRLASCTTSSRVSKNPVFILPWSAWLWLLHELHEATQQYVSGLLPVSCRTAGHDRSFNQALRKSEN